MKYAKSAIASGIAAVVVAGPLLSLLPAPSYAVEPPVTATEVCGTADNPERFVNPKQAPAPFARDVDGNEISVRKLRKQIKWLDFNEPGVMSGTPTVDAVGQSSVRGKIIPLGAVYEKELAPGYILRGEVVALTPLMDDTQNWGQRAEGTTDAARAARGPINIFASPQSHTYSHLRRAGMITCNEYTAIGAQYDGGNVGFTMRFTATVNGIPTSPTIVVADSEEAGSDEVEVFKTTGTPWKLLAEVGEDRNSPASFKNTPNTLDQCGTWGWHTTANRQCPSATKREIRDGVMYNKSTGQPVNVIRTNEQGQPYNSEKWHNIAPLDTGLGTDTFGPINTRARLKTTYPPASTVPIVSTTAIAPEDGSAPSVDVSFYVNSFGVQTISYGAVLIDSGDAPKSYGTAEHSLQQDTGAKAPYLGTERADILTIPAKNAKDWYHDDLSDRPDEGIAQLRGDGIATYPAFDSTDATYTIPIKATPGMRVPVGDTSGVAAPVPTYVRAWADMNGNGKFDADEISELITVNEAGTFNLTFTNATPLATPNSKVLGIRVRIAEDPEEIASPVSFATSGEVEDFAVPVIEPPVGAKDTTAGLQGERQTSTKNYASFFSARGIQKEALDAQATMKRDAGFGIVNPDDPSGALLQTYTRTGEGTYTVLEDGSISFMPEPDFAGQAVGVALRAIDINGKTTGWTSDTAAQEKAKETNPDAIDPIENNNLKPAAEGEEATNIYGAGAPTMDATYIPTVTPRDITAENVTSKDKQDVNQTGKPIFKNYKGAEISPSAQYPATFVDADGAPIAETTIPAKDENGADIGTYTLDPATGIVTFDPNPDFVGTAKPARVSYTDKYGKSAIGEYTPTVTPNAPTGSPVTSSGWQGETQTGTPTYADSNGQAFTASETNPAKFIDPATGQPTEATELPAMKDGQRVGTYTLNPTTGEVTFTPNKDFYGTPDGIDVQVKDRWNQPATAKYTPTVRKLTPEGTPKTSEGFQGDPQTGTPTFTDGKGGDLLPSAQHPVKLVDPDSGELVDTIPAKDQNGKQIGTYTIVPETGVVTFTPDKTFTGTPVPATVEIRDGNGTPARTTYTPTVIPVTPIGNPDVSTGLQGEDQTGTPTFQDGKVKDDGTRDPITPSADNPAKLVGENGEPVDSVPAKDNEGNTVGTYTIVPETGVVTFSPIKTFVGTPVPATVTIVDRNGTPVTATYTPTVTPKDPSGTGVTSIDEQGKTQTGTPTFKDGGDQPLLPSAENPATFYDPATKQPIAATTVDAVKDGKKIGEYTLNTATGEVTFTPNKDFVGTPEPVHVAVTDKFGKTASASYTPTVTPLIPEGSPAVSNGPQGEPQTGTPTFRDGKGNDLTASPTRPAKLKNPENDELVDTIPAKDSEGNEVGTYTIDPATGVVTFTPKKSFVGTPVPATVVLHDDNGTPAETTYTPTVTPLTPTGTPVVSEGPQGEQQTGTPTFKDGKNQPLTPSADNPAKFVDPATGQPTDSTELPAMKDGKQVGTYTIDPATGVVTFTPNKDFVGTPDGIQVQLRDPNGTPATGTYTPTVTPKPVVPNTPQPAGPGKTPEKDSNVTIYPPAKQSILAKTGANGAALGVAIAAFAAGALLLVARRRND